MITKDKILQEIKRTARENNNKPLGITTFKKETGIKRYEWMRYWVKFSDVLKDAGFSPNRPALEQIYIEKFKKVLIQKLIYHLSFIIKNICIYP